MSYLKLMREKNARVGSDLNLRPTSRALQHYRQLFHIGDSSYNVFSGIGNSLAGTASSSGSTVRKEGLNS